MTDGEKQAKRLEKTIRVSVDVHRRFQSFQYDGHFRSADVAMEALLAESVVRIPAPAEVIARWTEEAAATGFPLEAWIVQRVEAWPARCAVHASEVRDALEELAAMKRTLVQANLVTQAHGLDPIESVEEGV